MITRSRSHASMGWSLVTSPSYPVMIALGRAVCDRERHLTFFYYDAVSFESWFQASIKRNIAGDEIWVVTFHRQRAREVERQCMRYGVLWP